MNRLTEEVEEKTSAADAIEQIDELNRQAWEVHTTQPKLGLELSISAKELSEKSGYKSGLAYSIRNMGVSNRYLSNLETALSLSMQALDMFIDLKDKFAEAQAYVSIGAIYYYMGDYEKGLDYFLKGLNLAEEVGNKEAETYAYNGAGYIYGTTGENKKGLDFLHKALDLCRELKNNDLQATILDSLAASLLNYNQLDKAYETYNQCLKFSKNINNKRGQGLALAGIGDILVIQNKIEEAKDYFIESIAIYEEIGYKTGMSRTLVHLGKLNLLQKNYEQAKESLLKSLDVAESIKAEGVIYLAHEALAELYEKLEDFKSFKEHYKLFHQFKTEVFKEEQESRQKFHAAQQEIDNLKHEAEINRLTNVVLKEKNDELEKKKNELEQSYNNISVLSKIGQDITSTLNLDTILNTVYENVNKLLDATVFGIGIYNKEENVIEYRLAIENGKRYQPYTRTMEDKNQFPVWCIENKKEVFINDVNNESSRYIKNFKEIVVTLEDSSKSINPLSYIYLPLMVKEDVIGLIAVQSFQKNAYTNYHLNVFKNISLFLTTALENEKTYRLIEEQKAEIEQQNIELELKVEQRTEQILQQNEELIQKRDELEDTYNKVKLLSDIGQQITSTLNLDTVLNTVYENVNKLMDASVFGIGIFNSKDNIIEYRLAIENGKRYQPYIRTMEDKNQLPVWCIENKKEVFINNITEEFSNYIKEYNETEWNKKIKLEDGSESVDPFSYIYLPLMVKDNVIGLITVQSFKTNAYSTYQLDILKTLASYTAAALYNARSYETIQNTLNELKLAQEQLVQAEKLSSLGQLTAGIAHEINNPINFVSSNVEPLKTDLSEIMELINVYEKVIEENDLKEKFTEVKNYRNDYNIDFTIKEVDELLRGIDEGAKRTAEIVKGLRNFSRLDQNVAKMADLNEGLESTLVLLHNTYKHNIEIIKEYGNIPQINCFPGQINQIFMNILSNAVQAISGNGKIFLKTWSDGDMVKISVKDTGMGMSEETSKKIFDPFFTTKEVGKGTGLGLSITYGIIEKHKGKIDVFSEQGKGTEFIISLPTNQELSA